jgi:hypothetical protein
MFTNWQQDILTRLAQRLTGTEERIYR